MVACNCYCLHTNANVISSHPLHPVMEEGEMDKMNNLSRMPKLGFQKVMKSNLPNLLDKEFQTQHVVLVVIPNSQSIYK